MNNIEALRKLIVDTPQAEEAEEFLDAIQDELREADDDIKTLEHNIRELEQPDEDPFKSCNLGLDTLEYRLKHGNLKVQMQLEHWMQQMQKVNCVSTAPINLAKE